jgi:hypothetical protein
MFTVTATFDVTILYFVAVNVLCILTYILVIKHRARSINHDSRRLSTTIVDYFRENGNEVGVECLARAGGRRYVALISSKPSKRFRNSHLVELGLTAHVRKACGLDLEKVYWCFPVKAKEDLAQRDPATEVLATAKGDEYFDEELTTRSKPPGYRVKELSREKFEELVSRQRLTSGGELAQSAIG